jgi:hypothetical protein
MAIKTFATGEVLTASDTNTYLANSGLVYVTGVTFSGSSSVHIDNCFTSTYDNYLMIFDGNGNNSTPQNLYVRFVDGTTPITASVYGSSGVWSTVAAGTPSTFWSGIIGFGYIGFIGDDTCSTASTIYKPQLAAKTSWNGLTTAFAASNFANGALHGLTTSTTQYEGMQIYPSAGTMTGAIRIYGYRKA